MKFNYCLNAAVAATASMVVLTSTTSGLFLASAFTTTTTTTCSTTGQAPALCRTGTAFMDQSMLLQTRATLKMTTVDEEENFDIIGIDSDDEPVGEDEQSPFAMDVVVVETEDTVDDDIEGSVNDPSEKSWSELFTEAADVAVLLGGAAAKAASEAMDDLKTDIPSVAVPKSMQDAAAKASSLGDVAANLASSAQKAATGAIDGLTAAATSPKKKRSNVDVSIPYDSAARLAYEEWQAKFSNKIKRPSDEDEEEPVYTVEERFTFFQERYVNATVQNSAIKKQLREAPPVEDVNGTIEAVTFIELDQYADLSPEEYTKVMKSLEPKSWGDLFSELATLAGSAASSSMSKVSSTVKEEPKLVVSPKKSASAGPSPLDFLSSRTKASSSSRQKIYAKPKPTTPSPSKSTPLFGNFAVPKPAKSTKSKTVAKAKPANLKASKKDTPSTKKSTSSPVVSFPLFSSKPKKVETELDPVPARSTFSIFSGGSPKKNDVGKTSVASRSVTPKKKVATAVPTLSNWVQNKDGSITGKVSNSKNFRNGTKITTSPVRRGVKKGSLVKTGSGSQYKLN